MEDVQAGVVSAFREMDLPGIIREQLGAPPEEAAALEKALNDFLESMPADDIIKKNPEEILNDFLEELLSSGAAGSMDAMLATIRGRARSALQDAGDENRDAAEGYSPVARALIHGIRNRKQNREIGSKIRLREEFLLNKSIYQLTPEEIREMHDLIKRFGQKLKNRISLRKKRVKHGRIDIKQTLRSSLQYGGAPFKLFHKDKKIDRPQLVVLCDISGSVTQYSRFMMLLTYTFQNLFSKVRSFAFISNIVEITPLFIEMGPEMALQSIFEDKDFTYGWGSNYGRCFEQFIQDYSNSLTAKTTVLILGDGRNNNHDPGLDALIAIKKRCRNLLWLNPEKRSFWNWSDSIAYIYEEYCDNMKEVNNFLDLSEFIDKLFIDL